MKYSPIYTEEYVYISQNVTFAVLDINIFPNIFYIYIHINISHRIGECRVGRDLYKIYILYFRRERERRLADLGNHPIPPVFAN